MIRVILLGRTGNNFFQYAAGRYLSIRHGVPLILDGSLFNESGWNSVSCLKQLRIQARVIRRCSHATRILNRYTGRHPWELLDLPIYREPAEDLSFDPRVLKMPDHCVLRGYFQSPLYFPDIDDEVRRELDFSFRVLDHQSLSFANLLKEPDSVAVHVRRTDYINNPNADICDGKYYLQAMASLRERLPSLKFFIFSDDPAWCHSNFSGKDIQVVDCSVSRTDPLNDIHLMSLASHHIIANSSYSWWAAWLGKKPGQQVIMPSEWFRGIHAPISEKRLAAWETLPSI